MTTPFSKEQIAALTGPLNPDRVATRNQSGRDLAYLEAYDVKATLIRVFGFGNFSAECIATDILSVEKDVPNSRGSTTGFRVTAKCTVRLTILATGAVYTESAAASQSGSDPGEVTDFAIKTAESDALKRAATYLGTQFGLSLYNSGSTADVVRTVLEPEQGAIMKEVTEERAERRAAAAAQTQGAMKRREPVAEVAAPPGEESSPAEEGA